MGKAIAVDIGQCVEERFEHFANFFFAEDPAGKTSSEVFLRVFHQREGQIHIQKPAGAARQQAEQIWMTQLRSALKQRGLEVCLYPTTYKFDGQIFGLRGRGLRQEDRAVARTA